MVLTEVASLIKESIRSEDLAARYGGEEFVVLLPDVEQKDAFEIAERIRTSIEQKDFVFENQHMNVSISVGIAMYFGTVGMTAKKLVEQADMALYESKNTGRNKTSIYAEPVPVAKPKRKSSKKAKK